MRLQNKLRRALNHHLWKAGELRRRRGPCAAHGRGRGVVHRNGTEKRGTRHLAGKARQPPRSAAATSCTKAATCQHPCKEGNHQVECKWQRPSDSIESGNNNISHVVKAGRPDFNALVRNVDVQMVSSKFGMCPAQASSIWFHFFSRSLSPAMGSARQHPEESLPSLLLYLSSTPNKRTKASVP